MSRTLRNSRKPNLTLQAEVVPRLQQYLLVDWRPAVHAIDGVIKGVVIVDKEEIALWVVNPVDTSIHANSAGIRVVLDEAIEL